MAVKGKATTAFFYLFNNYSNSPDTGATGLTLRLIQDIGGVITTATPAGSVTEPDSTNSPGIYQIPIAAGENDFDTVTLTIKAGAYVTANPVRWSNIANVYAVGGDLTAGSNLKDSLDGTGYGIQPASGVTKVSADVASISGDTVAATNLESFFDGTGYGIQPALASSIVDADIAKINNSFDGISSLGVGANSMLQGSCTTGSTTSSIKGTGSLSTVDDFYNDRMLLFTGGAGGLEHQGRAILDYDGSSKTFSTDPFTSAPASGDTFLIV